MAEQEKQKTTEDEGKVMTETKVEIGGKPRLSREESERAILQANREEVVSLAFCAASVGSDGTAILDLSTGEVCARATNPPGIGGEGAAENVVLWAVPSHVYEDYRCRNWDRVEGEARADLGEEAYEGREGHALACEYARELSGDFDLPDERDFLHVAQEGLDRVYGAKG